MMSKHRLKDNAKAFALRKALLWLDKDPDKALPRLLDWLDKYDTRDALIGARESLRKVIGDPDNNWYRYIKSLWSDIDDGVRKHLFESFVINAVVYGNSVQLRTMEEQDCNIPWAILMDPTSACNLHCHGCWAAEYGQQLSLDYETLDDIIRQGRELGVYMYIYSGGEPLMRKQDILRLCEAHPECQFLAFTNGTLIDEEFADAMLRVKNFIPAISIEGLGDATDARRGRNTFSRVERVLSLLRERKLPFGASCCYTSQNVASVGSDAFIDFLLDYRCKFIWFFTFMPIGKTSPAELMVGAEQRKFMYDQVRRWRKEKPLFMLDFWNDGEFVNGCIAGGRNYLHINANGDIEPCAFIHYSDSNIREKTLLEACKSPLFMAYRRNRPFNPVHLRPCPLLDNPEMLARMVHESGAHSTDLSAPEDVDELCGKCAAAAAAWAPVAGELWEKGHFVARMRR